MNHHGAPILNIERVDQHLLMCKSSMLKNDIFFELFPNYTLHMEVYRSSQVQCIEFYEWIPMCEGEVIKVGPHRSFLIPRGTFTLRFGRDWYVLRWDGWCLTDIEKGAVYYDVGESVPVVNA